MIDASHEADWKQEFYGAVRQNITGARLVRHVRLSAPHWNDVITDRQIRLWGDDLKKACAADDKTMRDQNRARVASAKQYIADRRLSADGKD